MRRARIRDGATTALWSHFLRSNAITFAVEANRPKHPVPYELMFDSKQTLTQRMANAVDLAIDFATLGEYGLEPVSDATRPEPRSCEADTRVRDLYSLRIPRSQSPIPSCGSHMQANPFQTTKARTTRPDAPNARANRGPRRGLARERGGRAASRAHAGDGAA